MKRAISRSRSTPFAGFIREFNGDSGHLPGWAESFPRRRRWILALGLLGVTLVAIAVRAPTFGKAFTAPDTAQYLEVAEGIFHGDGFPTYLRPPGYSTLLAVFELVGLDPVDAVVTFQNLIGVVLPGCVLLAGWRFFSPTVGIVAGLMTAASPLVIGIEQFALADYLFSVLLFAAAVTLAEAVLRTQGEKSPWRLLVLTGVLFGLATLFRANGLYGLVAIPAVLLIVGRRWKPALRESAVAMGVMVVVIAPWCIHNLIRFGDPNVASEGGISLYARAVSYDEVPPSTATEEGRLARGVYNTADPNDVEAAVGTTLGAYVAIAEQTGKSPGDAAGAMGRIAREAIVDEPGRFLDRSLEILGRYQAVYDPQTFSADPRDQIATTRGYISTLDRKGQEAPGASKWTRIPWQIAQTLGKLLFVLTIGGLLMLMLPFVGPRRSRLAATAFLVVGILDIVGVTLTARFESRHGIILAPFVWILATATVALTVRLLVAAARLLPPLRGRAQTQGAPS